MGGPVDSDDDDECLFRECEKILLGIPRTSSDIFSCALTMKQLVAQLPIGCASDVSLKKVRQVLSQPAHQNVLIALDDARVVHVKKFGEQAHAEGTNSAEGPAGEPDDAACNFWDAPASLADAEQEGEEDAWRQNMMAGGQHKIGGDAQRGMLQERAERGAAQAATVSASAGASPTTAGKSVPVIKQRDPLKADLGNDKQGVAKPQMLLDKEPQPGANVPVVSSGAVRWLSGVPAEGGCTRQASKGDLRKDAAEAAGRVKQPNTTPGAGPPVAEMNGVAGSQTAASGLDPAAPGGGSVAWVSSGGGCGQEEGEKDAEEEELGKLKHCQDEIKRLLLQRHTMEAAIRARLAQRAQAPGQAAKARQLAAQLAQIVVDMPHLPGMGPEQAPAGTNAPNGVVSPLGDPGRHDADGHAAFPSAGRRSGGPGGRGAESGAESDVEVMDAPSAATEWAKKREAGLKRRREGQSEDAGAKRVRGPEVSEQGGETGREGHLEWRMRKEGEKKMDHLGAGQVGKGTPFRIVIKEEVNGLASRSAAPSDGGATPLVVARALGRPPGSSGGPGVHSAATGEAIPVEQRRSGVEAAAAPSSWLRPALVATAEERVTSVDTSEAAVTQVGAVAEVEQQRIVSGDENLVGRAPNVVQAKQRAPREENCSGDGPLEVRGQQLVRVPGEIPTGGTGVAIHAPASGAAKAHAADTTGAATEGAAQAGRGRGDSTSEQTAAATAGTKVVGLGFKRKRHGAAPKPKRKEPEEPVHLDWNINGEDEAGCALLETVLSQYKASAFAAETDRGWSETTRASAAIMKDEGLEPSTAEAIRPSKAQTRPIKHRKQDQPRRLVKSTQSVLL